MMTSKKPRWHHLVIFVAPALILYTIFMVWPLLDSIRLSFYAPLPQHPAALHFVGLQNYRELFYGPAAIRFQSAFWNTCQFLAIMLGLGTPLALLAATLLASLTGRSAKLYRLAIFVPTLMSIVIVGWVWQLMLNPLWGIINDMLVTVGLGAIIPPTGWLGTPGVALVIVALVSTWQFVGLPTVLFLVALLGIEEELVDSARVDGASSWATFWQIKFPLILPTTGLVIILTFILNFPAFDITRVMGGRNNGLLANYFFAAFSQGRVQGAVVGSLMFVIIGTAALIYFFIFQRRLIRDQ